MIPAPAHLVATYADGSERPVYAWDDDRDPLILSTRGTLVSATHFPGLTGIEQRVDDSPTMAVPGQGWQIQTTYADGTTWTTPVVAFAIDYTGHAAPIAQEEEGGRIWALDLHEDTSRHTGRTVRLVPPNLPPPSTTDDFTNGQVIL